MADSSHPQATTTLTVDPETLYLAGVIAGFTRETRAAIVRRLLAREALRVLKTVGLESGDIVKRATEIAAETKEEDTYV